MYVILMHVEMLYHVRHTYVYHVIVECTTQFLFDENFQNFFFLRYNYLDDFDSYSETDTLEGGTCLRERSDSFIYVACPPEVKRRFQQQMS